MKAEIYWINPNKCNPPHKITHWDKFEQLTKEFSSYGWDINFPALIGYWLDDNIQLISGSHRFHAAIVSNINIPVAIYDYSYIEKIWGTNKWIELINNPPKLKMSDL